MFDFIFSPIRLLRSNQCKILLEKLEEIENIVNERIKTKNVSKSAAQVLPIQLSQKAPSLKGLMGTNKIEKRIPIKKTPSSTILDFIPGIFGSVAGKSDGGQSAGLAIRRLPSNIDEKLLYK